jgi:ribosomal protein L19
MFLKQLTPFNPNYRRNDIFLRKRRPRVKGFLKVFKFMAGDILKVVYSRMGSVFSFEGLCLAVRGRGFLKPDTSFILRNVIFGVGMEINVSFYSNRVYIFYFQDYKRKMKSFYKSRLFFVRKRVNRYSKVK